MGKKNLIDVVVYDALACNFVWINHCIKHDVDVIVRTKNNSIREIYLFLEDCLLLTKRLMEIIENINKTMYNYSKS